MSEPIENMIGRPYREVFNNMVPATVICGVCQATLDAGDYREHRDRNHPEQSPKGDKPNG